MLFLFVNGTVYASQLHQCLAAPLTPLQKALLRLEKAGILLSYTQGKTRLYQFNPAYPLLSELEELIKKAYALLSPHDKKKYSFTRSEPAQSDMFILYEVWKRLKQVKHLAFRAVSKSKTENGWNGHGKASVTVTHDDKTLIFYEKGTWQNSSTHEFVFSNTYRWTLDSDAKVISLEHLRHGPDSPVFLFHLAPTSAKSLSSIDSHLCNDDTYFGKIACDLHSLRLSFRVIGPKKNEEIETHYT